MGARWYLPGDGDNGEKIPVRSVLFAAYCEYLQGALPFLFFIFILSAQHPLTTSPYSLPLQSPLMSALFRFCVCWLTTRVLSNTPPTLLPCHSDSFIPCLPSKTMGGEERAGDEGRGKECNNEVCSFEGKRRWPRGNTRMATR